MPLVDFSHTKEQEKRYCTELLKEKAWFDHANFSVFLPKDKNENEVVKDVREDKITWLKKGWGGIERAYFNTAKNFEHAKILSSFKCHVSRFGPEGKYKRPNMLFVRLRTGRDKERVFETIGHELLHLLFADFFESKKLNYSEKEGMIDALILRSDLKNLFSKYEKQTTGKVRPGLLKSILDKS